MKLKSICLGLLLFANALLAYAQQRPHYTQYILNNYILNPALSGIENYTDLKMSVRDQWVGLNGAPRTAYLSIHGPIGKKDYKTSATSFAVPGQNPRGNYYWENYEASAPHHGVGLTIVNDVTGNFNRFSAAGSYAYHIGLNGTTNISAGFSAGISRIGRAAAKSDFGGGVTTDPAQDNSSSIYKITPDIAAGVWLYSANYFVGISAQQVVPQRIRFSADQTYSGTLVPHLFATAGYRFLLSEEINALPSVLLKYVPGSPTTPQFDLNIKLQYLDLLWIGSSYRQGDGLAAMAGLNVNNTFTLGYAYDYTTSPLQSANRGSHELMIGFLLGNRYNDSCPRTLW